MRLLVAAIELGSFVRAGRRLGLSPASVSRRFKAMESDLGVRLVDRTTRRLAPSEAGREYYLRAKDILARLDELERTVSGLRDEPGGELRILARRSFGLHQIAPRLAGFAGAYPGIRVNLALSETPDLGFDDAVDVLVRLNAPEEKSLAGRRLATGRRVLCASPAYLEHAAPLARPADLAAHRCLAYRIAFEPTRWRLRRGDRVEELDVAPALTSNSGEVLRRAASDGLGVALLPEWLLEADLASGALVACLPGYAAHAIGFDAEIFAVWRRGPFVPAKVEAFVDYLAGCVAGRPWASADE